MVFDKGQVVDEVVPVFFEDDVVIEEVDWRVQSLPLDDAEVDLLEGFVAACTRSAEFLCQVEGLHDFGLVAIVVFVK